MKGVDFLVYQMSAVQGRRLDTRYNDPYDLIYLQDLTKAIYL